MLKYALTTCAFVGIILGKMMHAFAEGMRAAKPEPQNVSMPYMAFLSNQNAIMLAHVLNMQNKFVGEIITPRDEEVVTQTIQEIACHKDHLDIVQKVMDDEAENVLREAAIWATQNTEKYDLSLKSITLEAERSDEPERDYDIVLVFHVAGKGENALRFQGDVSRRLREVTTRVSAPTSVQSLRTSVRWS